MNKLFLTCLTLLFTLIFSQIRGQTYQFLAGDTASDQISFHNLSNCTVYSRTTGGNFTDLDFNEDKNSDIRIFGYYQGLGYLSAEGGISLKLNPGTCVALDTTNNNLGPKVFEYRDRIGNDCNWSCRFDTTYSIIYAYQKFVPPNSQIGGYRGNWINKVDKYMATMTIVDNDTLYGWVKLTGVTNTALEVVIKQYASQKMRITNIENQETETIGAYPNPFRDYLFINIPKPSNGCLLLIYNTNGSEMIRQAITNNKVNVDVNKLIPGIYIMKLINGTSIFLRKVIKI